MVGHLFVIEGLDGCGKSTQFSLLRETLPRRYGRPLDDFVFTREPGGSVFAESIRELILSPAAKQASGAVLVQLFGAARFDHLEKLIIPAIEKHKVVISDRFDASSYAYQLCAQGWGLSVTGGAWGVAGTYKETVPALFETQRQLIKKIWNEHRETAWWNTIVLDVDVQVGMERIAKRRGQDPNHFDTRNRGFHEAVRDGFLNYACNYPEGVTIVDGSRSVDEVHEDILQIFDRGLSR